MIGARVWLRWVFYHLNLKMDNNRKRERDDMEIIFTQLKMNYENMIPREQRKTYSSNFLQVVYLW